MLTVTIHVLFNSSWDIFEILDSIYKPGKNQVDPYDFLDCNENERPKKVPLRKLKPKSPKIPNMVPSTNDTNIELGVSSNTVDGGVGQSSGSDKSNLHDLEVGGSSAVSGFNPERVHVAEGQGPARGDGEAIAVARNYGFM